MICYCIICGEIKPKKETNKVYKAQNRYRTVPNGFSRNAGVYSLEFPSHWGGKVTRRGFLPFDIQVFYANSLLVTRC